MSVEVETQSGVTLVTLRRPGVRNAVDAATAHALHAAFVAFEQDDSAHVAVFQGAGGHFCAGWDLQSGARLLADGVTPEALADTLDFTAGTVHPPGPMGPSRLQLSKPVIAAIEGAAVAGGMELALWCDLRVMAEDAYMGVFCRRFGVPLIDGGTVRLPRLVGLSHALDLILTGRKVEADEDVLASIRREVMEEAGIHCETLSLRGTISWPFFGRNGEHWYGLIFLVESFTGTPYTQNAEGDLCWVDVERIMELPMWDGDRHFLPLVFDGDPRPFHGVMPYENGQMKSWSYSRV